MHISKKHAEKLSYLSQHLSRGFLTGVPFDCFRQLVDMYGKEADQITRSTLVTVATGFKKLKEEEDEEDKSDAIVPLSLQQYETAFKKWLSLSEETMGQSKGRKKVKVPVCLIFFIL